jgi:B12-binding domain/radical SAM domain protein
VYDFREHAILYGPVSDMVPSSTVFEMYPLGFLTIASYLHERGLDVRIVNLALRMMNDRRFDVPAFIARQRPRAVGIDLHWLPHAHGALEVARIVKEAHPGVPVILGGLSSTYFHRELIGYPQVDFVLRGDSTEPPLHQLLLALRNGSPVDGIPNLTWKDAGGIRVNPHTYVPETLDYVDFRPDLVVAMMARYRDFQGTLPFRGWWRNPIAAVFTVKGCSYECVTCGSSQTTCTHLTRRQRPVFRSPASLVANVEAFARLTKGPIALIGDLRQAGPDHAREVLERLRSAGVRNEIMFELFGVPRRLPAGHRSLRDALEHRVQPREPRSGGARRPGRRGGLHDRGDGGDAQGGAAPALRAPRRVLHDRPAGADDRFGPSDRRLLRAPVPAR